ncbi:MAG: CcmD family protein [Flavobacteriales bacterium]
MRKGIVTVAFAALSNVLFAQEMADGMRSEGKIYVVVGVVVLIFMVLFAYLVWMDMRLKKLEKEKKG